MKRGPYAPSAPTPIEFTVRLIDPRAASNDPAVFEFSITNTGNDTTYITSGPFSPFGVIDALPAEEIPIARNSTGYHSPHEIVFWQDAYANTSVIESHHTEATPDQLTNETWPNRSHETTDQTPSETIQFAPGETISQEYELRSNTTGLIATRYIIEYAQGYRLSTDRNGTGGAVDYRIGFSVQNRTATATPESSR